jgi:exopolysaccharide biosynthesis polyprenyl glycosylphosphotransferase
LDDKVSGDFCGIKILGKIDTLEYATKKYFIDEIYVTEYAERLSINDFLARCGRTGKAVRLIIKDFSPSFEKLTLGYLGSLPVVTCFRGDAIKANSALKRIFDICVAGLALCVLFPGFLIIAILITLESRGPVFYVSKRSGKKGVTFNCYKFRSMVKDADTLKEHIRHKSEVDGPIFKIKNDPRLTKVGAFLRKFSLDELPQLINVLKGDMSLVGPRPFPVEESNNINHEHIPRLNIRPGMTGLAQVKGRSNLTFDQWMKWDDWYVNNWSLSLDAKVIVWTIPAVVTGRGAY